MFDCVSLGVWSVSSHPRQQEREDSSRRSTGPLRLGSQSLKAYSILFDAVAPEIDEPGDLPECFKDLNLDQIVSAVTAGRGDYHLTRFFHLPLKHHQTIGYRQAVFRDLEDRTLVGHLGVFAQHMGTMRQVLADLDKHWYLRQRQRGFLEAVNAYCLAVNSLARDLAGTPLRSMALCGFRDYLMAYQRSEALQGLEREIHALKSDLAAIQYRLQIEGPRIKVSRYESDPDYGEEVSRTFDKFRQGETPRGFHFKVPTSFSMTSVEGAILDRVALLFPREFSALEQFDLRHRTYLDGAVAAFDREIQFYLGYLGLVEPLKASGLQFCYPEVSEHSKDIDCYGAFDLALAVKLASQPAAPVANDFYLQRPERILVVSGANQGGKTTFARMIGQLHYLGRLGCPVPGRDAKLFLFDQLFTHFEREEGLSSLRSKLEDDLVRIHAILEHATPRSLLIMNESFSSSTLKDALFLSREFLGQIVDLDVICVFVTFLDELASLGPSTVSMVAMIKPEDPAQRTFKMVRKPADGLAYALAIAEKHGLTYERARERLAA